MTNPLTIADHYSSGTLLTRLDVALRADGVDPARPTVETLAPYDQFHGRGIEATAEMANRLPIAGTDHILDIGSGIGGPARYLTQRFGCRVFGIDLTAEFCAAARDLTARLGLAGRVSFEQGNALAMPFADTAFDGAYSMNVSMNIADKLAFYREIHRVLRSGAWLQLSEVAQGPVGEPDFPLPWARTAATSFLATEAETHSNLEEAGFAIETFEDRTEESLAYAARVRALIEDGGRSPHRAVPLVLGPLGQAATANTSRALRERRILPIEIFCRKTEA